jgi:hypothetical protein
VRNLLCLIFFVATASLSAQTIRLVRTDVDSAKSHFVTATRSFAFDVQLDSVDNCNGVSFELRHSFGNTIKFSGWRPRTLGTKGTITVDLSSDTTAGSIHIGVLSGANSDSAGFKNPVAIHLEFVAAPDAPHNANAVFNFINPRAVIGGDSSFILPLTSVPQIFNIHGYVDVWPGDADNNGLVDTRDVSQIGVFIGAGAPGNSIESFKRNPASALWSAQSALTWDSTEVTYADCDGNGVITVRDILVVLANFANIRPAAFKNDDEHVLSLGFKNGKPYSANLLKIPVSATAFKNFIGASGTIPQEFLKSVKGIEAGEIFGADALAFYDETSGEFAVGSFKNREGFTNGVVAYILADEEFAFKNELTGITAQGEFIPLNSVATSVGSFKNPEVKITSDPLLKTLKISGTEFSTYNSIEVFDITGSRVLFTNEISTTIDVASLSPGVYIAVVASGTERISRTFLLF